MKTLFYTIILMIFGATSIAQAQEYPAIFTVTNVQAGDVLNVRAGPGVSHQVIGSLARGQTGVEVVGVNQDSRWARISTGEGSGWASTRFLTRTGPNWTQGLPSPLYCHGAEPFWSYQRLNGGGNWGDFQVQNQPHAELWSGNAAGRGQTMFALELDSGAATMTAFIRRSICSDGMSDRDFGLAAQFVRRVNGQTVLLDGCCALTP